MVSVEIMLRKLKQCVSINIGKALFSLFFMMVLETVCMLFIMAPSFILLKEDSVILPVIFAFAAVTVSMLFQSGFAVLLLRMYRKEYVTLGFILWGVKKLKYSLKPSLFIAVFVMASVILGRITSGFVLPLLEGYDSGVKLTAQFFITGAVFLLMVIVIGIRFVFLFLVRYDNPELSLFRSVVKSVKMMSGNVLKFIAFLLKAGGKQLVIALFILVLNLFIPEGEDGKGAAFSLTSFILEFIYIVNAYSAVLKMYFSVPVMYDELKKSEETPRIPFEVTV